ncbi:MAG TPA: triose-phosphate isomerase [Fimbriimonadales bacterium]|nr:triose-phosphate isomerase [Fimbriimonadales bacterium]
MARRRLVAGNWKMHLTVPEGLSLVESILPAVEKRTDIDVVVCPSFPLLCHVYMALKKSPLKLGAQDVFWEEKGAFTGQVSAAMLCDAGCTYCIVGHSERRGRFDSCSYPKEVLHYFSESDATVNLKLRRLLYSNLKPILCVGETFEEREKGMTEKVIKKQLSRGLKGIDAIELLDMAIAYEPVWAIGTGNVCDGNEAARVCSLIRSFLSKILSREASESIRVLYGGSVTGSNCQEFFSQKEIDGALVGGASLNAEEFSRIIRAA